MYVFRVNKNVYTNFFVSCFELWSLVLVLKDEWNPEHEYIPFLTLGKQLYHWAVHCFWPWESSCAIELCIVSDPGKAAVPSCRALFLTLWMQLSAIELCIVSDPGKHSSMAQLLSQGQKQWQLYHRAVHCFWPWESSCTIEPCIVSDPGKAAVPLQSYSTPPL